MKPQAASERLVASGDTDFDIDLGMDTELETPRRETLAEAGARMRAEFAADAAAALASGCDLDGLVAHALADVYPMKRD